MAQRRGFEVLLALILGFFLVAVSSSSAEAVESRDNLNHRQVSSFVRKNLQGNSWPWDSVSTQATPSSTSFDLLNSGSNRVRRLAGAASCKSKPNICNDTTKYPPGSRCCAATGTCINVQSDRAHCGSCGFSCAASLVCCSGQCTSMMSDKLNCGSCGMSCKSSSCSSGICGYSG